MITVFALATGRSGTRFLSHLLRRNLRNAVCRHEPYFDWGNPTMFGKPIEDHTRGRYEAIRKLLAQKQRFIARRRASVYVETSHAFLKSYFDLAPEFFPNSKFVHLLRHPLKTARSETNREEWLDDIHFPLRHYRGDQGRPRYRWSLTGEEPIFGAVGGLKLSLFQFYVVQWIEIENRAQRFLSEFGKSDDCVTLHSPGDLNNAVRVAEMIRFLGLELKTPEVQIGGKQNRTPGKKTSITAQEEDEFRAVVASLPEEYLAIFRQPKYDGYEWVSWLRR